MAEVCAIRNKYPLCITGQLAIERAQWLITLVDLVTLDDSHSTKCIRCIMGNCANVPTIMSSESIGQDISIPL